MYLATFTDTPDQPQVAYSPVLLHHNPAVISQKRNLTGLSRVTRDIVADVYNTIQKWNKNHIDGGVLVKQIALMKSDPYEPFPKGLDPLMSDLREIYRKLEMHATSLEFLSRQMESGVKLHPPHSPLFSSLTPRDISNIISDINKAYKSELTRKQYVLSNIAFSKNQDEALFHACCWGHQHYITNDVKTKLEMLLVETGHREQL